MRKIYRFVSNSLKKKKEWYRLYVKDNKINRFVSYSISVPGVFSLFWSGSVTEEGDSSWTGKFTYTHTHTCSSGLCRFYKLHSRINFTREVSAICSGHLVLVSHEEEHQEEEEFWKRKEEEGGESD